VPLLPGKSTQPAATAPAATTKLIEASFTARAYSKGRAGWDALASADLAGGKGPHVEVRNSAPATAVSTFVKTRVDPGADRSSSSQTRRKTMRKIIVGAQVSIDGVMQGPGGPTEDPTGGFKLGGWSIPYFNEEAGEEIGRLFGQPFDLLLGRKTYEIFAGFWPFQNEAGEHGFITKRFNEITKYPVSRSGDVDTTWKGTQLLRDIAEVKRLKQQDGPTLLTQGSTELVHALLANDLVDEISLFLVPQVLGGGKKLFADGSAPHSFKLLRSRVCSNGVIVAHYERDGDVKTQAAPGLPSSEREAARQARMKREG
jgi:dihydrofolate reductase